MSSSCATAASSRPLAGSSRISSSGVGIERMREQHAPQFAAGQHGERALLEAARGRRARASVAMRLRAARRDAETDRTALARQREEILDRDRQRADRRRRSAARSRSRPSPRQWQTIRPSKAIWPRIAASSVLLPAPLGPTMTWSDAARDRERHARRAAPRAARRTVSSIDLEQRRIGRRRGHASVTSARIIVSTFLCISRSNLSAVYGARRDVA